MGKINYYQNYNDFKTDFFNKHQKDLSKEVCNSKKLIFFNRYILNYKEYLEIFNKNKIWNEASKEEVILNVDEFIEWLNDKSIPIKEIQNYHIIAFPLCKVEYGVYEILTHSVLIDHLEHTGGYKGYYKSYNLNTHIRGVKRAIKDLEDILDYFIERTSETPKEPIDLNVLNPNYKNINNKTPEEDFSHTANKEIVILLDKLGIIDFIRNKQSNPETIQHTAEIISAFTKIKSSTLYTYLRPMLSHYKDDTDKNSPYKNAENIQNANRVYNKFKLK